MHRREVLATVGGMATVGLAGCGGDGGSSRGENEILVGPNNQNVFEPTELTVSTGTTVTWSFESATHNVSAIPSHNENISIPDGAEGFASYEGDNKFEPNPKGDTFEHTFETTGTFHYVCIPHASLGMEGDVIVE